MDTEDILEKIGLINFRQHKENQETCSFVKFLLSQRDFLYRSISTCEMEQRKDCIKGLYLEVKEVLEKLIDLKEDVPMFQIFRSLFFNDLCRELEVELNRVSSIIKHLL